MLDEKGSNVVPKHAKSATLLQTNVSDIFDILPVLFTLKANSI